VPGDRYRAGGAAPGPGVPQSPSEPGRARSIAILASVVVAAVGAVLFALVSQVDLGFGLVAIAMFIGWAIALALVWNGAEIPRRAVLGALLGGGAIAVGLLVAWAWGRVEGGALGPLEYVNERYGPLAYLEVLAAAGVAWYRTR
jgi:hypothetical protein